MAILSANVFHLSVSAGQEGYALQILIVEDSPFEREVLARILKQLGHSVHVASEGFEALSAVQMNASYDVIFMDCEMPLMNGLQATKFIRELERVKGQRSAIIGISTSALPGQCFEAGMDEFLSKPLNKMILKAVLGHWIRRKNGYKHEQTRVKLKHQRKPF
jgi:CheY-like chemotaxis protein